MRHDDDRERRSAAARAAASLLLDHRDAQQPPSGAAEAAWQRLQARIHAGETGPEVDANPRARGRGRIVVGAALAIAAAAILWQLSPRALVRRGEADGHEAVFRRDEADDSHRARARSQPRAVKESTPAPVPVPVVSSPSVPKDRAVPDLAAELAQLRGITDALRARDGATALARADEYLRAQPSGSFRPEARLHRAEALCLLGRDDDARAAAAAFLRDLPSSSLRARITAVCPVKAPEK